MRQAPTLTQAVTTHPDMSGRLGIVHLGAPIEPDAVDGRVAPRGGHGEAAVTPMAAGSGLFGPAGLFATHRHTILVGLTVTVAVVLALAGAQWFSRVVGWKRAAARTGQALRTAVTILAAAASRPARAWLRVRFAAAALRDPGTSALGAAAFAAVAGARIPGRPYLLAAGPTRVTVGATLRPARRGAGGAAHGLGDRSGRDVERQLGGPWRPAGPGRWTAARSQLPPSVAGRRPLSAGGRPPTSAGGGADGSAPGLLVAVGVSGRRRRRALVLLDLGALPAVGAVEGPPEAARRLAAVLAAQLAAGLPATGRPARLVVTDDVLPGYGGPPLAAALGELTYTPPPSAHPSAADTPPPYPVRTVLVCARPSDADAARLAAATRRDPTLRVLVAGDWPGAGFRLVLDDRGGLAAPEFGVAVDAAALERAVARALRRQARAPHPAPATPPARTDAPPPIRAAPPAQVPAPAPVAPLAPPVPPRLPTPTPWPLPSPPPAPRPSLAPSPTYSPPVAAPLPAARVVGPVIAAAGAVAGVAGVPAASDLAEPDTTPGAAETAATAASATPPRGSAR